LFIIEKDYFWSNRLVAFFKEKEKKSAKAKESAKVRWSNPAPESEKICERNANASKNDAIKERKGKKEKKGKKGKRGSTPDLKIDKVAFGEDGLVFLTNDQHTKLRQRFGRVATRCMVRLNNYIAQMGKDKYSSHYHTILSWLDRDKKEGKLKLSWEDFSEEDFATKEDYQKTINKYL